MLFQIEANSEAIDDVKDLIKDFGLMLESKVISDSSLIWLGLSRCGRLLFKYFSTFSANLAKFGGSGMYLVNLGKAVRIDFSKDAGIVWECRLLIIESISEEIFFDVGREDLEI